MTLTAEQIAAAQSLTITIRDVIRAGYCGVGVQRWTEQHGFDFRDAVKNGIPASVLLESGDAISLRIIKLALENGR